jgi:GAF domain-containing protein
MNLSLLLKKIVPASTAQIEQDIRLPILNTGLLVASGVGIVLFASNLVGFDLKRDLGLLIFYTIALLWMIAMTFIRKLPYRLRAGSLVGAFYLIALISLQAYGLSGSGRTWMVIFPVITTILLGLDGGLLALALSLTGWGMIAVLMVNKFIPLPPIEQMANSGSGADWLSGGVAVVALAMVASISIGVLLRNLETSSRKAQALATEIQQDKAQLAESIENRTQDLERRLVQIRTAAEISRALGSVLDPQDLLQQVVDLIKDRFSLYYVGAFLLDERGEWAILKAGTGEAGQSMISRGHRLAVGGASMIGWTTFNRKARIALDVGQEAVRFSNPFLPQTRSELALPIISGAKALGALSVQSVEASAFDEDDILVLQGIADSLATALENARLFQQSQASLDEIQTLHRQYLGRAWAEATRGAEELTYTYQAPLPPAEGEPNLLTIPISLRDQVIGSLTLELDKPELTNDERALAEAITNETAIALENTRLMEETQRVAQQERLVGEIAARVQRSLNLETVMKTAVLEIGKVAHASRIQLRLAAEPQPTDPNGNGHKEAEE